MRFGRTVAIAVMLILTAGSVMYGRAHLPSGVQRQTATFTPAFCSAQHNVGRLALAVRNDGTFGSGPGFVGFLDCFTGEELVRSSYPIGSRTTYLYAGGIWVGAVVGNDTLVSTADYGYGVGEFLPGPSPEGDMRRRSTLNPKRDEYRGAVSEQDFIAVYSDTFADCGANCLIVDEVTGRPHIPLGIEITQKSHAWSYPYAEDLVLFDMTIRNVGENVLRDVLVGLYVDGDVFSGRPDSVPACGGDYTDDISGLLRRSHTSYGGCEFVDTVMVAWTADEDGELSADPGCISVPGITGITPVGLPSVTTDTSFNWWVVDPANGLAFGPHKKTNFRDYNLLASSVPGGDRSKYAMLANGETDYDQVFTAGITPVDPVWAWPPSPEIADNIADGMDVRYLLSFGKYDLAPGESLPFCFAYVAGESFHSAPDNALNNLYLSHRPEAYYEAVDFSDLSLNAMRASWIFDNPGVDSDSDGYAGEYRLCCQDSVMRAVDVSVTPHDTIWSYNVCDTIWYRGDGVPDYRAAAPPIAPFVRLEPGLGKVHVRFNGTYTETTPDPFRGRPDFEGYRVYMGRDERRSSFSLLASYDREDYYLFVFDTLSNDWRLSPIPFTVRQLRCLYGKSCNDSEFDPAKYGRSSPYILNRFPDSILACEPLAMNRSEFGVNTPITKVYPRQPYPSVLDPARADSTELTEDGLFKFFEYQYTIENLLPTIPYYVNVTAFDFGSPAGSQYPLETSVEDGALAVYPQPSSSEPGVPDRPVYVYPNPYYLPASLSVQSQLSQVSPLRFANLPSRCWIRLFTLDGDLVREIRHESNPGDGTSSMAEWNLTNRNAMLITSGLYYWSVEPDEGQTQIGKLVVIR